MSGCLVSWFKIPFMTKGPTYADRIEKILDNMEGSTNRQKADEIVYRVLKKVRQRSRDRIRKKSPITRP